MARGSFYMSHAPEIKNQEFTHLNLSVDSSGGRRVACSIFFFFFCATSLIFFWTLAVRRHGKGIQIISTHARRAHSLCRPLASVHLCACVCVSTLDVGGWHTKSIGSEEVLLSSLRLEAQHNEPRKRAVLKLLRPPRGQDSARRVGGEGLGERGRTLGFEPFFGWTFSLRS